MAGDGKDGYYCTVCGGIPPDQIKIKKIPIDGKETGIDRLDWIIQEVGSLKLSSDEDIADAMMQRVQQFNYIPTKKMREYRVALLREYHLVVSSGKRRDRDDM
jgi:hypothetical protein